MRTTLPGTITLTALLLGCGTGSTPPPTDDLGAAAADVVARDITHVAVDHGPPISCATAAECSPAGLVCNADLGQCVGCNTRSDCTGDQVCLGHYCTAVTPCTAASACPGQVCSARLGFCVDCDTSRDCPAFQQCSNTVCVPLPTPCSSPAECAPLGLVCDPAQSVCVTCVANADCPSGRYCNPAHNCVPQVCTPGATTCQDATHQRICDAHGAAVTIADCPVARTCAEGLCVGSVCAPNRHLSCDGDYDVLVCNADGTSIMRVPCPKPSNAFYPRCTEMGVCTFACESSYGDCDDDRANGCETSLRTTASCGACGHACPAGQRCPNGACIP